MLRLVSEHGCWANPIARGIYMIQARVNGEQ